ncbi:MAG: hypothetical protein K2W92_01155 [Alphaproteobacteria bacterium]|nr:hypothetical protein [Alphaproteobacteria bacterium]
MHKIKIKTQPNSVKIITSFLGEMRMSETKTEIRFSSEVVTLSGQREYSGTSTISLGNGIAYKAGKNIALQGFKLSYGLDEDHEVEDLKVRVYSPVWKQENGEFLCDYSYSCQFETERDNVETEISFRVQAFAEVEVTA